MRNRQLNHIGYLLARFLYLLSYKGGLVRRFLSPTWLLLLGLQGQQPSWVSHTTYTSTPIRSSGASTAKPISPTIMTLSAGWVLLFHFLELCLWFLVLLSNQWGACLLYRISEVNMAKRSYSIPWSTLPSPKPWNGAWRPESMWSVISHVDNARKQSDGSTTRHTMWTRSTRRGSTSWRRSCCAWCVEEDCICYSRVPVLSDILLVIAGFKWCPGGRRWVLLIYSWACWFILSQ